MYRFTPCYEKKKQSMEGEAVSSYAPNQTLPSFILSDGFVPPLGARQLLYAPTFLRKANGYLKGEYRMFVTFHPTQGVSWNKLPHWVREVITSDREDVARDEYGNILFFMEKAL